MYLRSFRTTYVPPLQFSFLRKMNSAKNWQRPTATSKRPDGLSIDSSSAAKGKFSHVRGKPSEQETVENVTKNPKYWTASLSAYEEECPSTSVGRGSAAKGKRRTRIDLRTQPDQRSKDRARDRCSLQNEISFIANSTRHQFEPYFPTSFETKHVCSSIRKNKLYTTNHSQAVGNGNSNSVKGLPVVRPVDICLSKGRNTLVLNASLLAENMNDWIETKQFNDSTGKVLRPGMILLKSYFSLTEQVDIVKKCRELGLGPGGFYQPGYQDGAKLRLQMMCLGLNWDPQTRKYEERRPIDGSEPPSIPQAFSLLVKRAIHDAHDLIKKHFRISNVEDILPDISPDVCIVNFYTISGRLGLHQDRDEGEESLLRGLPVVSLSVGDSAEFVYGDQRDVDKADKVLLESGDVLIFGGKARHIFHGVLSVIPNSAPRSLLEEVSLRPGRLNLTFRQSLIEC